MKPVWLKSYPPGVPAEVDVDEYRSVGEVFTRTVEKFGPRAAFVNMGTSISYAELDRLSRCFGAYLQNVLKLHRGARIALMMPNLLQYPVAMFGALRSGYTVVNCNPLYSPRELAYQLKDSGAEAIVIVENFANVLTQAIGSTQVKHVIATQIGDLLRFPRAAVGECRREIREEDGARLEHPWRRDLSVGAGARRQCAMDIGRSRPRRSRLPAIYRRYDGRPQRRDAHSSQYRGQSAAGPRLA